MDFIISDPKGKKGDHWIPYHTKCHPCQFDYDAIIMLETADQDNDYVMTKSGMSNLTMYEKAHVTKGGKSSGSDIRQIYFSQVQCSLLKKVYDYYKLDFELFDYKPDDYYKICAR